MAELEEKNFKLVKQLLCDRLEIDSSEIQKEFRLKEDLGIDSLDRFELLYALEEELDIYINEADIEKCETIEDVVNLISKY